MKEKTISTEPVLAFEPALVLFGKDEAGKAHASVFGADDVALAARAAGLMQMFVLPVDTDECRLLAQGLPRGRIFASGKGFVPFAKMTVFEALLALGGEVPAMPEGAELATATAEGKGQAAPPPLHSRIAATRGDIETGALVLAPESEADAGWFEAVVKEEKPGGICVLQWQGWPALPVFVRHRDDLGLLPPPRSGDDTAPTAGEMSEDALAAQ